VITTRSQPEPFRTHYSSASHSALADAPKEKGGGAAGLGPHELLEAALATCMNMAVRMEAQRLRISLEAVTTSVQLDRTQVDVADFNYQVDVSGNITPEHRKLLEYAAENCPVRKTLSRTLAFRVQPVR